MQCQDGEVECGDFILLYTFSQFIKKYKVEADVFYGAWFRGLYPEAHRRR